MSYWIFYQICKQKIIDILNNIKKILNRIVSICISAKLIINDCTWSSLEITKKTLCK